MPAAADVAFSLFFIGDAGNPAPGGDPVLHALRDELRARPDRSRVFFLGDNIYANGLPDSTDLEARLEAERRLRDQLDVILESGTTGVVIPGNHDWAHHGVTGWDAIRRQTAFTEHYGRARIKFLPADGCPGPSVDDETAGFRFILLDTQWWLHRGPKPLDASSGCPAYTDGEVNRQLHAALSTAGSRRSIVVAHHPLATGGAHGGHWGLMDHLFPLRGKLHWLWLPLPVIGSVYPLARSHGWWSKGQDLSVGANVQMRKVIESAFADRAPFAFVSGHEHSLQVITGTRVKNLLVSGAGFYGHASRVTWADSTRYASSRSGFMRLDLLVGGKIRLGVIEVEADGTMHESFAEWLETP